MLAAVGLLEWPVALLLGVGHTLAMSRNNKVVHSFGRRWKTPEPETETSRRLRSRRDDASGALVEDREGPGKSLATE